MEQLRRFASVPLASRYYREALEHMGDMRRAYRSGILDKRFIERIMLAVTQVNGCKMCSYAHTRMALESGMSAQEIRCMLSGEFADVPDSQQKAILYAEHYAQTEGTLHRRAPQCSLRAMEGNRLSLSLPSYGSL